MKKYSEEQTIQSKEKPERGQNPKQSNHLLSITCYKNARINNLVRLWKTHTENPVRHITFEPNTDNHILPRNPPNRRVGRPRFKWVTETTNDIWTNIKHIHTHLPTAFDKDSKEQHEAIKETISITAHDPPFLCK